jgi:hypothetical protein
MYGEKVFEFYDEVKRRNDELPIENDTEKNIVRVFSKAAWSWRIRDFCQVLVTSINVYTAVYIYLKLLNQSISRGEDFRDGAALFKQAAGAEFQLTGRVAFT